MYYACRLPRERFMVVGRIGSGGPPRMYL